VSLSGATPCNLCGPTLLFYGMCSGLVRALFCLSFQRSEKLIPNGTLSPILFGFLGPTLRRTATWEIGFYKINREYFIKINSKRVLWIY